MTKKETVRDLWAKMCVHDGMDPETKFAVFSEGNPWKDAHNIAMIEYVKEFFGNPDDSAWLV